MPIEKPKKPTELVPRAFGGIKNNFSDDLQSTGFEPNIPQTYNGDNINYHLDATGKELDYVEKVVDYIAQMPVDSSLYVNPNNELDYINVGQFGNKADKDLANTGRITNCITEIPQRIKYTLVDGTLTIKAGSVVIVPYGVEDLTSQYPVGATFINDNFKVYDTQFADGKFFVWAELVGDISNQRTTTDTVERVLVVYINISTVDGAVDHSSGTSSPSDTRLFYNTSTNKIEYFTGGVSSGAFSSLPFGLCVADGTNVFASIRQIFNGMGYIGSTVWVDKGVKGLIPNGRNEDGTLKNIEHTIPKLVTSGNAAYGNNVPYVWGVNIYNDFCSSRTKPNCSSLPATVSDIYTWMVYSEQDNFWYVTQGTTTPSWQIIQLLDVGTFISNNNIIQNVIPKTTFKALDYSERAEISGWAMPSGKYVDLVLGASGTSYAAPANGWFCVSKISTATAQVLNCTNLSNGLQSTVYSSSSGQGLKTFIPVAKGDYFKVGYSAVGATEMFRFVYAQGEV